LSAGSGSAAIAAEAVINVLRNGRVSFAGSAVELHDDAKLREVYL
jgi:ABC-type branched-subunit amino acid transport system ATPase component